MARRTKYYCGICHKRTFSNTEIYIKGRIERLCSRCIKKHKKLLKRKKQKMNKELAKKIYKEVENEWIKKYGKENLDPEKLRVIKQVLEEIPDDDGNKRVTDMETGKTHLVPIKDIILKGLRGDCLNEYPEEQPPTYCKGCSFKCQASDCECKCHIKIREYWERNKKMKEMIIK